MQLNHLKVMVSTVWILLAVVVAVAVDLPTLSRIALTTVGLLPPIAILLLWNDPEPTMSESIQLARR